MEEYTLNQNKQVIIGYAEIVPKSIFLALVLQLSSWRKEQRTVCGKWIGEVIDPLEVVGHVDVHVLRHDDCVVRVATVEKVNVEKN